MEKSIDIGDCWCLRLAQTLIIDLMLTRVAGIELKISARTGDKKKILID